MGSLGIQRGMGLLRDDFYSQHMKGEDGEVGRGRMGWGGGNQ